MARQYSWPNSRWGNSLRWWVFQVYFLIQITIQFLAVSSDSEISQACSSELSWTHHPDSPLSYLLFFSPFNTELWNQNFDYQPALGSLYLDLHVISLTDPGHFSFPKSYPSLSINVLYGLIPCQVIILMKYLLLKIKHFWLLKWYTMWIFMIFTHINLWKYGEIFWDVILAIFIKIPSSHTLHFNPTSTLLLKGLAS